MFNFKFCKVLFETGTLTYPTVIQGIYEEGYYLQMTRVMGVDQVTFCLTDSRGKTKSFKTIQKAIDMAYDIGFRKVFVDFEI